MEPSTAALVAVGAVPLIAGSIINRVRSAMKHRMTCMLRDKWLALPKPRLSLPVLQYQVAHSELCLANCPNGISELRIF